MKKYNVEIVETLSKNVIIEAKSMQEAEKIARAMYADEEIVLDSGNFDNTVEFYTSYINPKSFGYLVSIRWDISKALSIEEMFKVLKDAEIEYTDKEIFKIVNNPNSEDFIKVYDKDAFDFKEQKNVNYRFDELKNGEYDLNNNAYKTKDGNFIVIIKK